MGFFFSREINLMGNFFRDIDFTKKSIVLVLRPFAATNVGQVNKTEQRATNNIRKGLCQKNHYYFFGGDSITSKNSRGEKKIVMSSYAMIYIHYTKKGQFQSITQVAPLTSRKIYLYKKMEFQRVP